MNRDCELCETFIFNISFKTFVSDFVICWANQRTEIPNTASYAALDKQLSMHVSES